VALCAFLCAAICSSVSGLAFSHAYYGAIRHAITVGFISLMIMGMAARVVPTLNGVDPRRLSALWGPFVLVNLGCGLRVSTQTLTDFQAGFFPVVGVSGMLEVAALAWWGAHLVRIMLGAAPGGAGADEGRTVTLRPPRIEADHHVADVIDWFPATLEVFLAHGFAPLRNPVMRRTVARWTSVRQAASIGGVELERLLADLNRAARPGGPERPASPRTMEAAALER